MRHSLLSADRFSSLRIAHRCKVLAPALLLALVATNASAATSRWSASNNRIYIEGGGSMSLTDIRATTPSLPDAALQRVGDTAAGVWLLGANIYVRDGSTLNLHGGAAHGDVNELRIVSNPSTTPATDFTNVLQIVADYGTIDIDGTKITSWDTGANGPDTNSDDGRSFIRVRSNDATGVKQESRMDVDNSEVAYLGWNASESYGLSWKANGDLATLNVYGNVTNSDIHHNYYGIYTFGLQDGQWTGNKVHDNHGYGFDAHDDSDNLVIDNNQVTNNGVGQTVANHGIILSERCDGARITNNVSTGNGGNGIMMHDKSDNAVIEGNTSSGNVDSGVALFCSTGVTVRNNTLDANQYGARLSVASSGNTFEGNHLTNSTKFGLFMYEGADTNGICGTDLVPHANTFTGNTISGSTLSGVKVTEGYDTHFVGNTIGDGVSIKNAVSADPWVFEFKDNTFADGTVVTLDGSATTPIRGDFSGTPRVSLHLDTGASARFTSAMGEVFDLARDLYVNVTGTNSQLDLTAADAGTGNAEVTTRALKVTTDGELVQIAPTQWEATEGTKSWIAKAATATGSVGYEVGDLKPGTSYDVARGSTVIGTFTADSGGVMNFSDVPESTETQTYTVTKSANQPQSGGTGGGSGGGGALDAGALAAVLLSALLGVRRRRMDLR